MKIAAIVDLARYPLQDLTATAVQTLLQACRQTLEIEGIVNLHGFMRPAAISASINTLEPLFAREAFTHQRWHNIYFDDELGGLAPNHPALQRLHTVNRTLCADQLAGTPLVPLYEWPALTNFLAALMEKPRLFTMADPLARINVMAYNEGEALNWHFDRSEFTVTLLLQAPEAGGDFEYRRHLRSDSDPNYDGVARLLAGEDPQMQSQSGEAGDLTIFLGKDTAHRVSAARGSVARIVAVFSYYETASVRFSAQEQLGFYGRASAK